MFSNLHLFKQINIDLIFYLGCILYLLHTEDAPFYTRDLRIPRRANRLTKSLQSVTERGEEVGNGGGAEEGGRAAWERKGVWTECRD